MESSSFSDAQVIGRLNADFIPLRLNITDDGFPPALPGLEPWHQAWLKNPFYRNAFATSVVLEPSGSQALATSGAGYTDEVDTATNSNLSKYLDWLSSARESSCWLSAAEAAPETGRRESM